MEPSELLFLMLPSYLIQRSVIPSLCCHFKSAEEQQYPFDCQGICFRGTKTTNTQLGSRRDDNYTILARFYSDVSLDSVTAPGCSHALLLPPT